MQYSPFTTWILSNGISDQILELLIAVTILATIVSLARYIFGSKSYGIYAPIILAIAYSYTGLKYGLAITAIVIITSLLSYSVLKKIRMHYITRIAINYCILTLVLITFLIAVNYLGLGLENMENVPALAMISIAALGEFFTKQYIKKSFKNSILILLSTILISTIGWFVITRNVISTYLFNNLWIIPILILVNLLIGQFKGLRIKDLFRFKSIVRSKDNV
ncbi:MAG: 7TM domain-containing protein [Candidatus Dojkabacteria bacterium]|nr:7TM domain-containing protein [Candidatus Dojkabacteria bacterium]